MLGEGGSAPVVSSPPGQAGLLIPMPRAPQRDDIHLSAVNQSVQCCQGVRAGFLGVSVELPAQTSAVRTSPMAPSLDPVDGTTSTPLFLGESCWLC